MSHATCTQDNRVNSRLLVVKSQITNLTFDHSFGHNLCYKCRNGRCKPIFGMYSSRDFQSYKERLKARSFDPYKCALMIRESFRDSNSHVGNSLGSGRVHALTFFALPGACEVTPGSSSWPAIFQPLALVASPRLGLRQHNSHLLGDFFKCLKIRHV
jgi:hypothetical protein